MGEMIAALLALWRTFPPRTWLIFAVLAAFLIFGAYCVYRGGQGERTATRKAQAGQTLADRRTAAAQDASAIRDRADARDQSIASIVTQAEKEIRHAPDRNAAADAARRRVCQLSDYRDAQCAVFRADPGRVD